jgi:uncharacterized RDD family membrane protein YckC
VTASVVAGRGIVTPQGVVLDLEAAGIGYRGASRAIDTAGFIVLTIAGLLLSEALLPSGSSVNIVLLLLLLFLLFFYPAISETFWRGRTVGKAVLGLRVVTLEAGPIGFREALIRSLFQLVDFGTFGVAALLSGMTTDRSQRIGDVAAGTFVVREPKSLAHVPPVPFTPPMGFEGNVAELDVSRLRPEQERLIRSFLLRVGQLSRDARIDLGTRMAQTTADRLGHELARWPDPETYLVGVMAARQMREGGLARLALTDETAPRRRRWRRGSS